MNESQYKSLPDFQFRSQYDVTPRPDADVEAALRGEFDKPADAPAIAQTGIRWLSHGPQRIR